MHAVGEAKALGQSGVGRKLGLKPPEVASPLIASEPVLGSRS